MGKTTAAGGEALGDYFTDAVFIIATADHIGGVRTPGDGVIGADLLGAVTDVSNGGDGNTAEVFKLAQHTNFFAEVFTAAVVD